MDFIEQTYLRTLKLIMTKGCFDVFSGTDVEIRHSVGTSVYCQLQRLEPITEEEIEKLSNRMQEIITENFPIIVKTGNIEYLKKNEEKVDRQDIKDIISTVPWLPIREYEVDGYKDYYYDKIYPSTGLVPIFQLEKYANGFLLKYPLQNSKNKILEPVKSPKLTEIQENGKYWEKKIGVSYIGELNKKILNGEGIDLIRISETLHEAKLAKIAEEISEKKNCKLITIAGPSSSGKTTFSNRLTLFLRANSLNPVLISLDNYYIGRSKIPLDEHGKKDFESIEGLDLELLNSNLYDLIHGKEVEIPEYDFVLGERKIQGKKLKLPNEGIIIIEGIHGLNERLTKNIPKEEKYKIYISCLTQLNIDLHNRIPTSEVRKIRRIVRDSISRGTSCEETLEMWKSVRRGEEKNIFPYQEEADMMFNSNLVYELAVLKPFAIRELLKVKIGTPHYEEAKTLIRFLSSVVDIDDKYVPDTSILKEFIGGSYFYNY